MNLETMDFVFPAGEVHVTDKVLNYPPNSYALHDIQFGKDMGIMDRVFGVIQKAAITKQNAPDMRNVLFMRYLPFSRQDRATGPHEVCDLKLFAEIINHFKFDKVYTLDAHSDVAAAVFDNFVNIPIDFIYTEFMKQPSNSVLIIPDQGAFKKLNKLAVSDLFDGHATCIKTRNPLTGYLEIEAIYSNTDLTGRNCVIIDDICDGGMTFKLLARELVNRGVAHITLCVTHGIFSKHISELHEAGINNIITTDSYLAQTEVTDPSIRIVKSLEIYQRYV